MISKLILCALLSFNSWGADILRVDPRAWVGDPARYIDDVIEFMRRAEMNAGLDTVEIIFPDSKKPKDQVISPEKLKIKKGKKSVQSDKANRQVVESLLSVWGYFLTFQMTKRQKKNNYEQTSIMQEKTPIVALSQAIFGKHFLTNDDLRNWGKLIVKAWKEKKRSSAFRTEFLGGLRDIIHGNALFIKNEFVSSGYMPGN